MAIHGPEEETDKRLAFNQQRHHFYCLNVAAAEHYEYKTISR